MPSAEQLVAASGAEYFKIQCLHSTTMWLWHGTATHVHTHTHTWSTVPTTSEVKSSRRVLSAPGGITQRNLANFGISSDTATTSSLLQMQGRRKG